MRMRLNNARARHGRHAMNRSIALQAKPTQHGRMSDLFIANLPAKAASI